MNLFFESLNYTAVTEGQHRTLPYYSISNADGSPRWVFPSHLAKPYFLKFYHVAGFKSQAFALLSMLIFAFRLQRFIYKRTEVLLNGDQSIRDGNVNLFTDQWALFTGTAGPNNKMVLFVQKGDKSGFMKIPVSGNASELVKKEHLGTLKIKALNPESFAVPETELLGKGILRMDDIAKDGSRSNTFMQAHKTMLSEIAAKTAATTTTQENDSFQSGIANLKKAYESGDSRLSGSMLNRLQTLADTLQRSEFTTSFSHGDFTPWNMFVNNGVLAVYDWELAHDTHPLLFDAFHFIIQKGILIDRKSWKEIRTEINMLTGSWGVDLCQNHNTTLDHCLKLYLFVNVSNHLELYSRQKEWHTQIHWLIETWNEALCDVLSTSENNRGLLIDDIFVRLHNTPYATIKFPNIPPSELSAYSDIDICLKKYDALNLINQLKSHSLVQKVIVNKTSFMATVQIILKNNDVLNLDLIWQLKWKNLEMMPVDGVLSRVQTNRFGIKVMKPTDLINYLGLFYGLNGAMIPEKYMNSLETGKMNTSVLHAIIVNSAQKNEIAKEQLVAEIKSKAPNKGFSSVVNSANYIIDTLKGFIKPKGMIITFSGVDGAGKSTVIEHIRTEFEKKMRRKVVVLRHRPSLLPILSAWTKGKAQAESDAAHTLPRQGSNQSMLSSVVRFSYYYTDYLAGQFYIYIRHVLRGDIVLYDRYYFDFINDSVRSNIRLPERFLRAGYFFLMKPDYNFFLYADADTILSRKQELDRDTISALTGKYLTLFKNLGTSKKMASRYIAIENKNLDATINQIISKTTGKAA
ncbi:MAG: phosphotransferase [Bacteroidetes bacterium]|nr:phosphotransferase [Bacteroidota bacterium]